MEATQARTGEPAVQATTVKVFSQTIEVKTADQIDLVNITDEIRGFIEFTGITAGHIQISCLHTTAALFVNEWQDALLTDIKAMLENVVPRNVYYKHNDLEYSDCDRNNAHSHLRNVVLGHCLTLPIAEGQVVLGTWQNIILSEFDGPNQRKLFLQVFGI